MKKLALPDLRNKALAFHEKKIDWHFHILTPGCKFNEKAVYGFIVEDVTNNAAYVHYSAKAEKQLGKELSPLLHGKKAWEPAAPSDDSYVPSDTVKQIVKRVKELPAQGTEWHHHVLFPGCRFNKNTPKFTFVFEDSENNQILESITDDEPTDDLKQIEKLFYTK